MDTKKETSFTQLPDELLLKIYSYIESPKDIIALTKTTKDLRRIAFSHDIWDIYQGFRYCFPPSIFTIPLKCPIESLAKSQNDCFLTGHFIPDDESDLQMWSLSNNKPIRTAKSKYDHLIKCICIVQNKYVITNGLSIEEPKTSNKSKGSSLLIWDIYKLKVIAEITDNFQDSLEVKSILNFNERLLIIGLTTILQANSIIKLESESLRIWDFEQRKVLYTIENACSPIQIVDDKHFACKFNNIFDSNFDFQHSHIHLYNIHSGQCINKLRQPGSQLCNFFILKKRYIVSETRPTGDDTEAFVYIHDTKNKNKSKKIDLRISDRGKIDKNNCFFEFYARYASVDYPHKKTQQQLNSPLLKRQQGTNRNPRRLMLTCIEKLDEKTFLSAHADGRIEIWNTKGNCLTAFELNYKFSHVINLSNGFIACYLDKDKEMHSLDTDFRYESACKSVEIYNVYTQKHIQTFNASHMIKGIFKYDDSRVIIQSYTEGITIFSNALNIVKFPIIPENRLDSTQTSQKSKKVNCALS